MSESGTMTRYKRQRRGDRLLRELEHDPYHSKVKLSEPSVCPECRTVFHNGRWTWDGAPEDAHEVRCPACQRIHDRVPAAFLTLQGQFLAQHHDEIMNLVHNYEQREQTEHPLKRVMDIDRQSDQTILTFTDAHLARGIGEALHHAYKGELEYQYVEGDVMLRVNWSR